MCLGRGQVCFLLVVAPVRWLKMSEVLAQPVDPVILRDLGLDGDPAPGLQK